MWAFSGGPTSYADARSSPDYFPVYETAADLGVAICVHEGARTVLEQAGSDRYSEFWPATSPAIPLEQMLASLNFCADGVLRKNSQAQSRLFGIRLRLGAVLARAHGRTLGIMKVAGQAKTTKGKAEFTISAPMLGELARLAKSSRRFLSSMSATTIDHRHGLSAQRLHRRVSRSHRGRSDQEQSHFTKRGGKFSGTTRCSLYGPEV